MTTLLEYISDPVRAAKLAADCDTSVPWLWQIAVRWKPKGRKPKQASHSLAIRIEKATRGVVTRSDLRPDIWEPVQLKRKRVA